MVYYAGTRRHLTVLYYYTTCHCTIASLSLIVTASMQVLYSCILYSCIPVLHDAMRCSAHAHYTCLASTQLLFNIFAGFSGVSYFHSMCAASQPYRLTASPPHSLTHPSPSPSPYSLLLDVRRLTALPPHSLTHTPTASPYTPSLDVRRTPANWCDDPSAPPPPWHLLTSP